MELTVSIIVPVYNVKKYIRTCVDSILRQTYRKIEVILVDDGSTDGSEIICDEYATKDPRVKAIHQENAGAANAKNAGLDIAQGQYIGFLDSDDWVSDEWIEQMLNAIKLTGADAAECKFSLEYIGSSVCVDTLDKIDFGVWTAEEYLNKYISIWTCAIFWNKLFNAELLRNIRFHCERRCIDDEFFTYKAISGASSIVRIEKVLYCYRQRKSSVMQSSQMLYQRTSDYIDVLIERYNWIYKFYPVLAPVYLKHDVDTLLFYSNNYPFDCEAASRFKKCARYYLKECIHNYPGRLTLLYAFRCVCTSKRRLIKNNRILTTASDLDNYFV